MKLDTLQGCSLTIPFKTAFRHASAERAATQTLWVTARADGHTGYGEGCPREYVTGESLRSAAVFIARHAADFCASVRDLQTLSSWANLHVSDIERNPAAWAAVELALLDLIGKLQHKSVESLLGVPAVQGRFRYTAVLGDAPPAQFEAQLAHYLKAGFGDFKIKLSGDESSDRAKVRALKAAGLSRDAVRADANNVWPTADGALAALEALDFSFRGIEEPLRAGDYAGMARVAAALDTKIILDESVLGPEQLDRIPGAPDRWIVNLRVSKMGGVLRSLKVVSDLRRRRLGLIVGAQVGETSLLTRAALTVANAARDILLGQEGAFGTHLLARDVAEPPLMFGSRGILDVSETALTGAGWGLSVNVAAADLSALPHPHNLRSL
jgi:L-alanine-DL-glutamate epimerase-like enolase superfamily enzyme